MGDTNNPVVCRAPIVIIRIAAAESTSGHALRPEAVLFKRKFPRLVGLA